MSELFFVIKTFILTVLLVAFLQIPYKGQSLEDHLYDAILASQLSRYSSEMFEGAKKLYWDAKKSFSEEKTP